MVKFYRQNDEEVMEYSEFKRALEAAELNTLKRFNNFIHTLKAFDLKNEKVDSLDKDTIQLETINSLTNRQDESPERESTRSPKERVSVQGSAEYEVTLID